MDKIRKIYEIDHKQVKLEGKHKYVVVFFKNNKFENLMLGEKNKYTPENTYFVHLDEIGEFFKLVKEIKKLLSAKVEYNEK